ncbi:hypothetical protein OOA_15362, partial [Providencia burhodogranariea DSM 19968]
EHSPANNPQGPEHGEEKVTRGADGSFYLKTLTINRLSHPLKNGNIPGLGFRCAVQSPTPISKIEAAQ